MMAALIDTNVNSVHRSPRFVIPDAGLTVVVILSKDQVSQFVDLVSDQEPSDPIPQHIFAMFQRCKTRLDTCRLANNELIMLMNPQMVAEVVNFLNEQVDPLGHQLRKLLGELERHIAKMSRCEDSK